MGRDRDGRKGRKDKHGVKPQRILDDLEETIEEWRDDFPDDGEEDS